MIKVLVIGGEPCTGKTTLMKKFIKESGLDFKKKRVNKLVDLMHNEEKDVYILGVYEDSLGTFQGTDKLSMAVQPNVIEFFEGLTVGTVIFEGDRLFNSKMLNYLADKYGENFKIIVLKVSDKLLEERHIIRKDDQDDTFKNSRKTKVNNVLSNLDLRDHIKIMSTETKEQQEATFNELRSFV